MSTLAQTLDLALQHHGAGHFQQAEQLYRQILQVDPQHADVWHFLGLIAGQIGRNDLAVEYIGQAVLFKPAFPEALNHLGLVLYDLGKKDEAEANYRKALRLKPDYAEALNNLGYVVRDQGKLAEAEANFRKALRLKPGYAEAHNNLGLVLQDQGKLAEAEASYRESLRLEPDNVQVHFNLSCLWLLQGNLAKGWLEYEWRHRKKSAKQPYSHFPPTWDGTGLDGQTILLHAEQGLGDTLQFIRYAPLVKQRGGRVLFECPAELVRIIQSCPGIDQILPMGYPLPPFDVQSPLMSLPGILKTTLANVPAFIPYLNADPALTEGWRQELANYSGFKIGIVWQGNPRFSQPECRTADQRRSIPLAQFEPIVRLPGVQFFSLQKGYGTEQLAQWPAPFEIIELGERLMDFMDMAAVMMNLDLIISVDTSPVHLAGALGRPVWTVLPFAGCWRWLQDREDSPWYASMRLFRQRTPGDWEEVFQRIAEELDKLISRLR